MSNVVVIKCYFIHRRDNEDKQRIYLDCSMTEVYIKGACINNGFPDARAGNAFLNNCCWFPFRIEYHWIGYGIWWGVNDIENRSVKLETNPKRLEKAEFQAAITAIEQAKKRGICNLVINTDCNYIISMANNLTEFKNRAIYNGDRMALEAMDKAMQGIMVIFMKERAKTGIRGNDEAYQLAHQALQN